MNNRIDIRLHREEHHNDDLDIETAMPKLEEPPLYQVILLNDDYTPMDFVVEVLEVFFYMDREKATQIMLTVHTEGEAVCGVYSFDIAETKMAQVKECARENEHPLMCTIKRVDS